MRKPCCDKEGTNKGAWSKQEDQKLTEYIKAHGEGCWRSLPKAAGLQRCGKSCRLRWINYLRPDIKRGNFGQDEEDLIIKLHALLGNRWSLIAGRLPGRTDNEVKNYWNSHIRKKLIKMGIDPNNHRLNQIQIVQAQIPVLRANIDNISHEQLKPSSTAIEGMSAEENHACMASSAPKSAHGESKNVVERANSDAGSCLEDETSAAGTSSGLNLDLTIAFPTRRRDELKLVEEIKTQSRECKLAKEVEMISSGVISSSPTLILFR